MPDLLDELDPEQRQAAMAIAGPVCIIAGAGTGKTRTVTYRLAHAIGQGATQADRALAVTHSRKAAAELKERLGRLGARGVDARTFHAAGLRVAAHFWSLTGRPEPAPSVIGEGETWRTWRDSLRGVIGHDPDNADVRDLADEVGWARSRLIPPQEYPRAARRAGRQPGVETDTILNAWDRYEATKARTGKVDFGDLLEIAAGLLETDDTVSQKVRSRWAHVTVDEYQDTDPSQQRLLDAILGPNREICVVGDPRQAIYSWKGADPRYLTGFTERYRDARVFVLSHNYRSSPQILSRANRLAVTRTTSPLIGTRPAGPAPKVTRLDHEAGEAAWVVAAAKRAIASGTPVSEIAVLYRYNATQARFEAAFARADIATVVAEDVTFFDRPEVRAALVPFGRVARAQPDHNGLETLTAQLARNGFDPDRPPPGLGAARARWESQLALLDLIGALPGSADADALSLLRQINALATSTLGPRDQGVTLATLHRAKGLEWDVVFVVGVTDGAIPSSFAVTRDQLDEEERLLHVGVTRARRELHLTWAEANGRGWTNRPSPFLDQIPDPVPAKTRRGTSRRSPREASGTRGTRSARDSGGTGTTRKGRRKVVDK
jgi:DNA helicase-2/ATP-dependent DNA helicase PcrA